MKPIAHISTSFPTKFGLPRQSGVSEKIKGVIVFEPEYRVKEAFRGLEDFSHIWVLWQFSEAVNGLMAIPNLITLAVLAPEAVRLTNEYKSGV